MKKSLILFSILLLATLGLPACSKNKDINQVIVPIDKKEAESVVASAADNPLEVLEYLKTNKMIAVSTTSAPFDYTVEQLKNNAQSCGFEYETGYFENLIAQFKDTEKIIYNFKYLGEGQAPDSYRVTLIPNKFFSAQSDFKKDFRLCEGGADAYPKMMNGQWLVFESSCGTGFSDSSDLPIACEEAKKIIEPTLKLNSVANNLGAVAPAGIIQTETITELVSGKLYKDTVNHYSYVCPKDFNFFDGYDFNGRVKVSECVKKYSDNSFEFIDGISLRFEFVPNDLAKSYLNGDKLLATQKMELIKSEPGAKEYRRNSFSGWMSSDPGSGAYIFYLIRREVTGGFYEINATIAIKDEADNIVKEERQKIVNEVIDSFSILD